MRGLKRGRARQAVRDAVKSHACNELNVMLLRCCVEVVVVLVVAVGCCRRVAVALLAFVL